MRYPNVLTGLLETKKISDDITLLVYKDRESLCTALCRIEEHYESPEFNGKIFTLGQYREWYSTKFGAWSYYKSWSGFNIPSKAFEQFFKGLFDPLSPHEAEVVDLFRYKTGNFCVIGTFKDCDSDVYDHEISHALFSTNNNYKQEVVEYMTSLDKNLDKLKLFLIDLGYSESVLLDECHAYIGESHKYLKSKNIEFPEDAISTLKEIKSRYV